MVSNGPVSINNLDEDRRAAFEKFLKAEKNPSPYQNLNPTPLGLCAFALTTFMASMYLAGATVAVDASLGVVMGPALCYGGLVQLLAGLLEYRAGNSLVALIFASYGGFWLSFASLHVSAFNFTASYSDTATLNNAYGVFFLAWTIYTVLMLIAVLRTNFVTIFLFVFLIICFILLTASKFLNADRNLQRASGAFGILTAAIAWYSAIAHLLNKMDWFFELPLFEVSSLKKSMNKTQEKMP